MSLTDVNGGGLSAADVAAVTQNGFGGFGGDGAWWLLVLFLFAMNGGNWGGFGNGGGAMPYMMGNYESASVQRGFDQQAVMSGIGGINSALANAEVSRCNSQANILQTLNSNQNAVTSNINSLAMGLQNCCCENRAGLADLKYTVATENCADRQTVSDGIRDLMAAQTANTQAMLNAINERVQSVTDKLCQLELDAKNETIAELRTQLNMANLASSQTAQTGQILADNAMQTAALKQALNPTPIPAYVVQNPSCCNPNYFGTGCGCGTVA